LMLGFWFMSSTLAFYNPIYLNPRHLIILVPILAFLIGMGWKNLMANPKGKLIVGLLIGFGILVALLLSDWKMAAFQAALILPLLLKSQRLALTSVGLILIAPAMYSIYYQKNLKQYEKLIQSLTIETQVTDTKTPIYTHSFIDFSKKVLLPDDSLAQQMINPLYKFPTDFVDYPPKLKVLIYDYYKHAYPEEQVDIETIDLWLLQHYLFVEERKSGNVTVRKYTLR
jgi:prepilin signal peptidase PulO-like enzyme (type II secretory pathway)